MSNCNDVIIIIDESGSMDAMGSEPVQAMNEFISEQKKDGEGRKISLYSFNGKSRQVFKDVDLDKCNVFTDYTPSGMTALYDCIGTAIEDKFQTSRTQGVFLVIITDGFDNLSRTYSKSRIKTLLSTVQKDNNWKVIYLAANQDSIFEGSSININHCSNFDAATPGSLSQVVRASSARIRTCTKTGIFDENF